MVSWIYLITTFALLDMALLFHVNEDLDPTRPRLTDGGFFATRVCLLTAMVGGVSSSLFG